MVKSEWYTNRTWNGMIDSKFEKYLKHTRNPANKADFMQIQGSLLLNSPQQNVQNVGVSLLTRVIEDYPTEHSSATLAQEKLGCYYLKQHDFKEAERNFRTVNNYCKQQNSRTGTSAIADLLLAETILKSNLPEKLQEAYQLVMDYPVALLKMMDVKFYYTELAAQVCDAFDKKEQAKEFAIAALALPKLVKPFFKVNTHLVKTSGRKLRSLQEISVGG